MAREDGRKGIGIFLGIAVVEHLVFVVGLAIAIYYEPPSTPIEVPVRVEIIKSKPLEEKPTLENPIAIAPLQRQTDPSQELPPISQTASFQRYLQSTQSESGLPDLPRRRISNPHDDRLSLGTTSQSGRRRENLLDETADGHLRTKPVVTQQRYGPAGRTGLPNGQTQQRVTGDQGRTLPGRVESGHLAGTDTKISKGHSLYEITGEASGREVISGLETPLQSEGQQGGGVHLSFKVRSDGTVFNVQIKPGRTTVGEVKLKEKAKQYVSRIRFSALPKHVQQVVQSGEIFINFTRNVE